MKKNHYCLQGSSLIFGILPSPPDSIVLRIPHDSKVTLGWLCWWIANREKLCDASVKCRFVRLFVNFDQFFGGTWGILLATLPKGMCSVLKFWFLSQLQDVLLPAAKTAQPLLEQSTVDSTATSAWASRNGRKPTGILSDRVIAKIKGN